VKPFDPNPECNKCGATTILTTYHDGSVPFPIELEDMSYWEAVEDEAERRQKLERKCLCGHVWYELPKDFEGDRCFKAVIAMRDQIAIEQANRVQTFDRPLAKWWQRIGGAISGRTSGRTAWKG
jgi:hypothetical protein